MQCHLYMQREVHVNIRIYMFIDGGCETNSSTLITFMIVRQSDVTQCMWRETDLYDVTIPVYFCMAVRKMTEYDVII